MKSTNRSSIRARRKLLENPYAFVDQMEHPVISSDSSVNLIRESRLKLQNQYAYLDGNGQFSAHSAIPTSPRRRKTDAEIETAARELQRKLWLRRNELWPKRPDLSPVLVLDPGKASEILGYRFAVEDTLGLYQDGAKKIGVAGIIDRESKVIRISREFDPQVQAFTAAHELGHLVLHPEMSYMHRDRGVSGVAVGRRDGMEYEADKFAAFFLMPGRLVRQAFHERFLTGEFVIEDDTAFALLQKSAEAALAAFPGPRQLARYLASTSQYNGQHFYSLAEFFGVTVETMAIRIEELGLVRM